MKNKSQGFAVAGVFILLILLVGLGTVLYLFKTNYFDTRSKASSNLYPTITDAIVTIPDLVSYYKFDDPTGDNLIDSIGVSSAKVYGVTPNNTGKLGLARNFVKAQENYIDVANSTPFDFKTTDKFTISAWVYPISVATYNQIVNKAIAGVSGYGLRLTNGIPMFYMTSGSVTTGGIWRQGSQALPLNAWTHIVATYAGTGTVDGVKIYINGLPQNSYTDLFKNNILSKNIANTATLKIGKSGATVGEAFDGAIDEVGIWKRNLTDAEVNSLFNFYSQIGVASSPTPTPTPISLGNLNLPQGVTSYYTFNDSNDSSAVDSIGGANGVGSTGVTVNSSGKLDKAKSFDKTKESFIDVSNQTPFNFTTSSKFTFSAWVKPSSLSGYNQIVNKAVAGVGGYGFRLANGNVVFYMTQGSVVSGGVYKQSTATVPLNTWSHVAVTYDGSRSIAGVKLYINGVQTNTTDLYSNDMTSKNIVNSSTFKIGKSGATVGEAFGGSIDEVGVWGRDLTSSEVSDLYRAYSRPISYYVSPNGNDSNLGTEASPFKTLSKAKSVVRKVNQTMQGDVNVILRGGTYQLDQTLNFDSLDSGFNGYDVVYKSYPNETAIISGGKQVTGWTQEGNKWKAYVGTNVNFRQLYVNGNRATRARSDDWIPNATKTATGFTISDPSYSTFTNQSDIEVVDNVLWRHLICGVQNITSNSIIMKNPCWDLETVKTTAAEQMFKNPDYLENAFELLDKPGEWYFNKYTGWLYYMPRSGENISSTNIVTPIIEKFINAQGNSAAVIRNLQFNNLIFAYTTWNEPSVNGFAHRGVDGYLTQQDWPHFYSPIYGVSPIIPGAVDFRYSQNIKFNRNYFLHIGSDGATFGNGVRNVEFVGNHLSDISASGIRIGEIDNPYATNPVDQTANFRLANNYITSIGVDITGTCGVYYSNSNGVEIDHNEVTMLPYVGICGGSSMADRTGNTYLGNLKITNNFVHDVMRLMADGGGIHTSGKSPNSKINNNVVINNNATNRPFGGIYLDDNSRFYEIANNVIFNNIRTAVIKGGGHNIHDNWWQDRGDTKIFPEWPGLPIPDLWIYYTIYPTSSNPCFENIQQIDCGPNTLTNNHIITNLSQVPSNIINNAGIESQYQGIKSLPPGL